MRKFTKIGAVAAAAATVSLALSACGATGSQDDAVGKEDGDVTVLKVGATPVPQADILKYVDENLAEDAGLKIEVKEYTDYALPNQALDDGDVDANYFQHVPYFDEETETKGYDLEHFDGIHIEPLALYSEEADKPTDIKKGGTIAVPNDPSNQGRALKMLEDAGLFKIKDGVDPIEATLNDIGDNPKNLKIIEAEAATLPRTLGDVDGAVINGNFALEGGLEPSKDSLYIENAEDNPYANVLTVREGTEDDKNLKKLDDLLHSDDVEKYIKKKWKDGTVLPAF